MADVTVCHAHVFVRHLNLLDSVKASLQRKRVARVGLQTAMVPHGDESRCHDHYHYHLQGISLSSRVSDVAKALQRSFPDYAITWEHQDSTSGYSIDMRVEGNHAGTDVVWAVEVDGPSHFLQVRSTLSWVVLPQIPQCSFFSRPYH